MLFDADLNLAVRNQGIRLGLSKQSTQEAGLQHSILRDQADRLRTLWANSSSEVLAKTPELISRIQTSFRYELDSKLSILLADEAKQYEGVAGAERVRSQQGTRRFLIAFL